MSGEGEDDRSGDGLRVHAGLEEGGRVHRQYRNSTRPRRRRGQEGLTWRPWARVTRVKLVTTPGRREGEEERTSPSQLTDLVKQKERYKPETRS